MPTDSKEVKTTSETAETLEQRIERLERENSELKAENEKLRSKADQWNLKEEIVVNRLYRFWKSKLEKTEVDNLLKNLNGEHKTKIENFIKKDKIEDLQKYLNDLINVWAIDKKQLVNNCMEKWIRLRDWHIFEDGKFWPQTFEAIKCLSSASEWWSEDGDKDRAKDGAKDWNKDKWKDGEENYDYSNPIEWRDKKLYKAIKLASLDELPKDYKWPIPSNYERWREETYATVYHVTIRSKSKKPYIFYGNGTCRSPLDDQIYDSKAIVEKLKNGRFDWKESYSDADYVKKEIQKMWKLSFSDKWKEFNVWVKIHFDNKYKISLYLNENQNIYTTLSIWDIVDKEGNISEDYFKKVIFKQAEKKLLEQYYAYNVAEQWKNRNEYYPWEWIFWKDTRRSYQLDKYSRTFANEIIRVEFKWFEWPYIKINLKNSSKADYNKFKIHYLELVDKNWNFSNLKLKGYLKNKIIEIANEHFK